MNPTLTLSPASAPTLGLARKLSRVMVALFAMALLLNLMTAIVAPLSAIFRTTPSGAGLGIGLGEGIIIGFKTLSQGQAISAVIGLEIYSLPRILAMYHILMLFLGFARGDVFAAKPIAHLRLAGWWLTASFFASVASVWFLSVSGCLQAEGGRHLHFPGALIGLVIMFRAILFAGVPTIIAAYVMEEARRIAADHAEIV